MGSYPASTITAPRSRLRAAFLLITIQTSILISLLVWKKLDRENINKIKKKNTYTYYFHYFQPILKE